MESLSFQILLSTQTRCLKEHVAELRPVEATNQETLHQGHDLGRM
jgi:hypothetical protein